MKERLDDFIEQSQENCSRCFEDHEKRLRILEIWQWRTTGLAAGVAAGITYIGNILLNGWAG